jgi:hypothetical protein
MKRKNVVIGVIGAMILLAVIIAFFSLFSSSATIQPLILNTITLRNHADDSIIRAEAITELNSLVDRLDSSGINEGWRAMASCIPQGCSDDDYMNFIAYGVNDHGNDLAHGEVIKELIKVHRFWGDETNVIVFSQSLTNTNNLVNSMHVSTALNLWNDLVVCNGECAEFDDLFFEIIEVIVQL